MPESETEGNRIINPDDFREWLSGAPHLYSALTDWLRGQPFDVTFHKTLAGASGSYVALVECRPDYGRISDRIIKLMPPDIGTAESFGVQQAAQHSSEQFARRHLVHLERPGQLGGTGWWVYLQEVAQGGLTNVQPLSSLLDDPELGRYCGAIVTSIAEDWQQGSDAAPARITAADFLRDFLGDTASPERNLTNLLPASLAGASADLTYSWQGGRQLPNPMALLRAALGGEMGKVRVFRGNGHGDLHGGNILVPTQPQVDPSGYKLIDLGRFSAQAPISRDPMKLLLSLSAAWVQPIAPGSPIRENLAEIVVAPWSRHCTPTPGTKGYLEVAGEIHRAARSWADTRGAGHDWDRQNQLVLAASALRYAARPDLAPDDRWWFFGVAARATREMLGLDSPVTAGAALLRPPERVPAPRSPGHEAPGHEAQAESRRPAGEASRPWRPPGPAEDAAGPGGQRTRTSGKTRHLVGKRLPVLAAILVTSAVLAVIIPVLSSRSAGNTSLSPEMHSASPGSSAGLSQLTSSGCTLGGSLASGGGRPDPRTNYFPWPRIFLCAQGTDNIVYVNANYNQPFATLQAGKSFWVVCWIYGQDGTLWYYTEADYEDGGAPKAYQRFNGWGFVSADTVAVRDQPAYPVTACPSVVPAG